MIAISGSRDLLIAFFAGQLTPREDGRQVPSLNKLPPTEISLVYSEQQRRVPDLLVVDTPNLQEFFAWCSTYLPHWSPLSAGMSIVERRKVENPSKPHWTDCPRPLIRGLLCLSLGELLFEWQSTNGRVLPSILSLRSTFGYAASAAITANRRCLSDLLSRWMRAQHLLQLNPRRLNSKTLKTIWDPVFKVADPRNELSDPETVTARLADAISGKSQPTLFKDFASLPVERPRRQHLVVELEEYIRATSLVNSAECFQAAAIASMMSSSPLAHFDVLSEMTNAEPRSLLWYSFLSGLFATDPATATLENMLYRVEGEIGDHPNLRPDISIDELEVLIGPTGQAPDSIGTGARFLNVELDYGVCASFRLRLETAGAPAEISEADDVLRFDRLVGELRGLFERRVTQSDSSQSRPTTRKTRGKRKR